MAFEYFIAACFVTCPMKHQYIHETADFSIKSYKQHHFSVLTPEPSSASDKPVNLI